MDDLSRFGSATRCLLRLRENRGLPVVSDKDVIRRYLPQFPAWEQRPGELGPSDFALLAEELKLAVLVERTGDYDRLVREFQAGRDILVCTDGPPFASAGVRPPHPTTSLVVAIDPLRFTLWWPDPSGLEEVLPPAERSWWDAWKAVGVILVREP